MKEAGLKKNSSTPTHLDIFNELWVAKSISRSKRIRLSYYL